MNSGELIPTIVQDARTGAVLMLAWSNPRSVELTLEQKRVWFYSRSRRQLWMKGESSGNVMSLVEANLDCDEDAILYQVVPAGPACHTMKESCFHRPLMGREIIPHITAAELYRVILDRKHNPGPGSYTAGLLAGGREAVDAKIMEEAREVVEATDNEHLVEEVADLCYHVLVMMAHQDIEPRMIRECLGRRHLQRHGDGQ